MTNRIVSIYFPHLLTEWVVRRKPVLADQPFVLAATDRGRRIVTASNAIAEQKGALAGMVVADCKALVPGLEVLDHPEGHEQKLLAALGEWCIRFTPVVMVDGHDGLLLDASGCCHLWGGESQYLGDIQKRLSGFGYHVKLAMADTPGAAWAIARYGISGTIVTGTLQSDVFFSLPPQSLRIPVETADKLMKLGLKNIRSFISMPRTALRRRFGMFLLQRIDQALGDAMELLTPIIPLVPFQERLPVLDPVCTRPGIEIALRKVLESICARLNAEAKGLRKATLSCYRVDGGQQKIEIGTHRPSANADHLFKLFFNQLCSIAPGLGIELFVLDAPVVEPLNPVQDALWSVNSRNESAIAELLDRLAGRTGGAAISRFLPAEHYWPERSFRKAASVNEAADSDWRIYVPRPLHLLPEPQPIEVSVPMPDYPPLLFRHKGELHTVMKADGPERIEQEWWMQNGLFRDYYCVEDQEGRRYWVFREGDFRSGDPEWFLHGYFC